MDNEHIGQVGKDKMLREKRFLYESLREYTPCAGRTVSLLRAARVMRDVRIIQLDGQHVTVWTELPPFYRTFARFWSDEPLMYRLNYDIEHGNTHWFRHQRLIDYARDPTEHHILLDESLKKFQHEMDVEFIHEHGPSFFRTTERTAGFRDDLEVASRRRRAIHNCKVIKEELMAAAWHPRRVEHILETYGWEVYENLLGD